MNIVESLPITTLINRLKNEKGLEKITFEDLKDELIKKEDDEKPLYYINFKESDDLCILYYNDIPEKSDVRDDFIENLEKTCRSTILEKDTLQIISSQYNQIMYNSEARKFLVDKKWENIVVQKCYEGTMLVVFNHKDKWYISTRRCLDASMSTWIKDKSYREMFEEAIDGKIKLDDLDKNLCYHFILIHHKNRNIVTYNQYGENYKEVILALVTEKYTLNEVNYKIENLENVKDEKFSNLDEVTTALENVNRMDKTRRRITTEGYILKVYDGKPGESPFTILKLQTDIYQTIMRMKPNNSNIYQSYLELYQKDKLADFLPYFTKYSPEIIKRIHIAMRNVAKEVLDLYHSTRQKKNEEIYNNLTERYKKILYELHGLYIHNRKQDFTNDRNNTEDNAENDNDENNDMVRLSKTVNYRSINVHDVYHHIKSLPARELRGLFYDRMELAKDNKNFFLNRNCIYTKTQTALMFGTYKKEDKKREEKRNVMSK